MRRLAVLDGVRGYFLVFMLINHLTFTGGSILLHMNHAELGFVQDAQGFVFLSGLLIGMVYARRMQKEGFRPGAGRIWKRALELYAYAMACVVVILLLGKLMPYSWAYWGPWLGQLVRGDLPFRAAAATLLYQPTYMDILPQYIIYLLVSPPLVWLCLTGRAVYVIAISAILWLAVQVGLDLPLMQAADAALGTWRAGLATRSGFNPLGWQLIFMSGLVLGALSSTRQIDWRQVMAPERTGLVKAAALLLAFFAVLRLSVTFGLLPDDIMARLVALERRTEFGAIGLINFVAAAYVLAWLLMAGPEAATNWVRKLASGLTTLFQFPALRLIGRHSLQVYAWHVVLVYLVKGVDWHYGPFDTPTKIVITCIGVALLAVPALLREVPFSQLRLGSTTAR